MEKTRSFVEQRRQNILAILEERGRANVADLAERLGTSALTIRRDLTALEERGEVERRYGEAVLVAGASSRTEAPASRTGRALAAELREKPLRSSLVEVTASASFLGRPTALPSASRRAPSMVSLSDMKLLWCSRLRL